MKLTVWNQVQAKILDPLKWSCRDGYMLYLCWKALRKYHNHNGDGFFGDQTYRLTKLNYLRAVLSLYYAVDALGRQDMSFTDEEVQRILNMNEKYWSGFKSSVSDAKGEFDALLVKRQELFRG